MIRLEESGPVILDSALSMGVNTGREGIVSEGKGIYLHQNIYLYGIFLVPILLPYMQEQVLRSFNCDA